ncbi:MULTISPECIES: HAD family hydrolase [Streptomyces]|uniref:HAD family hydrolase n=1 Tax=Streptomyces TaxID=1883 RepID=UPI00345B6BF2
MITQQRLRRTLWGAVRGICFDLGGTLVRTEADPTTGQVAQVLGISLDQARAVMAQGAKRCRITPEELARDLVGAFGRPDLLGRLTQVLERARQRAAAPDLFADARPALTALHERGFGLFALSNVLGSSVPDENPAAFAELLDQVIYSADFGAVKPEREAFAAVEHASGLAPDQLLHVGDSLRADVAGADAAGWHTAWLDRGLPCGPLLSPARTLRLHTLTTLPLLLPAAPAPATAPTMPSEAR